MLAHFLALGDAIQARIAEQMPDAFRLIAHAADLAGVKDSTAVTPALQVWLAYNDVGTQLARASAVAWDQEWYTIVVTRSAKDAKSGAGAIALAGPLCSGVIAALAGWTPAVGCLPLQPGVIANTGHSVLPPLLSDAGTQFVPLVWHTRITQWSS